MITLKLKRYVNMQLKNGFLKVYDWLRTQQMCHKAFLQNAASLESVPVCYKSHETCDKDIDHYPHAL